MPGSPAAAGQARTRPLTRVPRLRCQLLGRSALRDPHGAAERFQREWEGRQLRLLADDCGAHARQLAALLLQGEARC